MTLSESELKTLHQLVEQDDGLRGRVQAAQTALDMAQIMAQAGRANGLSVTSDALLPHIESVSLQSTGKELNDVELADVAGGKTYTIHMQYVWPNPHFFLKRPPVQTPEAEQMYLDWMRGTKR